MTVTVSVEQAHKERYAKAREALWGKPRKVNIAVEEKRAIEEYQRAQRLEWERKRKIETEWRQQMALHRRKQIVDSLFSSGTSATFLLEDVLSYWSDDASAVKPIRQVKSMSQIARNVLAGFPGITIEDVRGKCRTNDLVAARWAVVREINRQRPDVSNSAIARFVCRDHTSVLYMLGRLKKRRKHKPTAD